MSARRAAKRGGIKVENARLRQIIRDSIRIQETQDMLTKISRDAFNRGLEVGRIQAQEEYKQKEKANEPVPEGTITVPESLVAPAESGGAPVSNPVLPESV